MNKELYLLIFFSLLFQCKEVKREYSEDGSLVAEAEFKNGVKNGMLKLYYSNGNLKEESYWEDGERDGKTITYFQDGRIEREIDFSQGKPHGLYLIYYKSGKVKSKFTWVEGTKIGPFEEHYENGELSREGEMYGDSASLKSWEYYENGWPKMYYYSNDSIRYFKNFSEDGKVVMYHFPIKIDETEDEICMKLLHSILPPDSLYTAFYLGISDKPNPAFFSNRKKYLSDSSTVCIPSSEVSGNKLEGMFCEFNRSDSSFEGLQRVQYILSR